MANSAFGGVEKTALLVIAEANLAATRTPIRGTAGISGSVSGKNVGSSGTSALVSRMGTGVRNLCAAIKIAGLAEGEANLGRIFLGLEG